MRKRMEKFNREEYGDANYKDMAWLITILNGGMESMSLTSFE